MMTPTRKLTNKELKEFFVFDTGRFAFANFTLDRKVKENVKTNPAFAVALYWRKQLGRSGISAATFAGVFGITDVKKVLAKLKRHKTLLHYGYCGATNLPIFSALADASWERDTFIMTRGRPYRPNYPERDEAEKTLIRLWGDKKLDEASARKYGGFYIHPQTWNKLKRLVKLYACK